MGDSSPLAAALFLIIEATPSADPLGGFLDLCGETQSSLYSNLLLREVGERASTPLNRLDLDLPVTGIVEKEARAKLPGKQQPERLSADHCQFHESEIDKAGRVA